MKTPAVGTGRRAVARKSSSGEIFVEKMLNSLENIHSAGRSQSMDKSLPLSEKAEEKEKEEEGVVRSLQWEPRIR